MRHLKLYRAVRLIHREGSIRKAAERLAVSPSALNRSIQAFEEELGVDVFDRIASGVRLSSAGELLLDVIDRHLSEYEALLGQISDLRDGLSGHLRISIGTDIEAGLVLDVVAEFEEAHPGVSVEVIPGTSINALRQRQVDLAVITHPTTDDAVEVLHAVEVTMGAWCRDPVAEGAGKVGLWDIVSERLILPPEGTGTRAAISHLLRRHQLPEGVSTTVPAAQVRQRIAAGRAVAIFPDMVFAGPGEAPGLHRIPLDVGRVQCAILRAAKVPMTRPTQAVFNLLQGRLDAVAVVTP